MILANDFSSGLIRFQKLLAQMANRVLLDLARAGNHVKKITPKGYEHVRLCRLGGMIA